MAQADIYNEQLLTIRDHVNHLRQWAQQQQPILHSLDTDEFLLRFLRVTDFRIENAKEWIIHFWQYRTENPQWFVFCIRLECAQTHFANRFKNRDLLKNSLMCQIAELAYCLQLPKATKDKHLIFLIRMGQYDPTNYTLDDVTRYAFAVTDIINSQPAAQLYGSIILVDFTNIRFQHITQFTPDRVRRYVDCWEKIYPVHLRQIHFYNYPSFLNPMLYLFRLFYHGALHDRIYYHSRSTDDSMKKSLQAYLDPSILPNEYGGQLGSVESNMNEAFIQWTQEQNDSMVDLEQYGVDLKQVSHLLINVRKEHHI